MQTDGHVQVKGGERAWSGVGPLISAIRKEQPLSHCKLPGMHELSFFFCLTIFPSIFIETLLLTVCYSIHSHS
jgi:hypothetical protein